MIIFDAGDFAVRPTPINPVEFKGNSLWTDTTKAVFDATKDLSILRLNMDTVRAHIEKSIANKVPALFNFEEQSWDIPRTQFKKYVFWWQDTWSQIRSVNASVRLGVYSETPINDYWNPVQEFEYNPPENEWERIVYERDVKPGIEKTQALNKRLRVLIKDLDVICPSIYLFYPDNGPCKTDSDWAAYARWMISEAAKYHKPVYAVVWPRYHTATPTPIELDRWQKYVYAISKNPQVDGIIVFDSGISGTWAEVEQHFDFVRGLAK